MQCAAGQGNGEYSSLAQHQRRLNIWEMQGLAEACENCIVLVRDVGRIKKGRGTLSGFLKVRMNTRFGGLSNASQLGGPRACSTWKFRNLNLLRSPETCIFLLIFEFSKF